jgi:hypothetical protein
LTPTAKTAGDEEIAIDVVIVHGTPSPDILHALHITGYRPVGPTTRHAIYARTRQSAPGHPQTGDRT